MSTADHHLDRLQAALALGAERARRLAFLLREPFDECGVPTVRLRPLASKLLATSFNDASDAAADLGIEMLDQRWTGLVAILHAASRRIPDMKAAEAKMAAALLDRLRQRAQQLRHARAAQMPVIRLA
jgi:hypothetical protein